MNWIRMINWGISLIFTLCYSYQFLYIPISLFFEQKKLPEPEKKADLAVLICARNEETVIGDLLRSIREQNYPAEKVHVFVMADNCTDHTAELAGQGGAIVYTRTNQTEIGKGYALRELLKHIRKDYPAGFDAYLVFDADNILKKDYLAQMNRSFQAGNELITGYRNSKNYGTNWITAGYGLWFLRESRYLSGAREVIGSSCHVSGTGFLFSRRILEEMNGTWPFHMLTEDIEFSICQITKGRHIAYCPEAELFDEQPLTFAQSWRQRMRWAKGYWQVFGGYGRKLIAGMFSGSFSCFDMTMNILPAFILSALSILLNLTAGILGAVAGEDITILLRSVLELLRNMYLVLFFLGIVTMISEWNHIHTSAGKKLLYCFTFPIFMATYIPISVVSLFKKVTWTPIKHSCKWGEYRG